MRKSIFIIMLVFFAIKISAQEKGKIRYGGDLGVAIPNLGIGITGNLEARYNILDNFNAGYKSY